eukprot:snap_masked-scaffold_4-processed-gene-5.33-mRNA-1 protein AED:1.00 eAED:1.00 QI:0/-1/0/0/-1/1/1/0/76
MVSFEVGRGISADKALSKLSDLAYADGWSQKTKEKRQYLKPSAVKYAYKQDRERLRQKRQLKRIVREALIQKSEGY